MKNSNRAAPEIHPTAVVHPKAELGRNVVVGPYSVVGPGVILGDDCEVMNHVSLAGPTVLGRSNRIFPYASIGQEPQDKKFDPRGESRLEVGNDNVIREFVTLNRGTEPGGGATRIGNGNWIMAYSHVAHDCHVGNETIMANNATLGGHVTIEDGVYMGGFTAVHQFCTIGELTMTGGHTMIAQDVPPYVIAVGNRARLFGVNRIGLERRGFPPEEIRAVQAAYKMFFRGRLGAQEALARIEGTLGDSAAVRKFLAFIRNSTRGICR